MPAPVPTIAATPSSRSALRSAKFVWALRMVRTRLRRELRSLRGYLTLREMILTGVNAAAEEARKTF